MSTNDRTDWKPKKPGTILAEYLKARVVSVEHFAERIGANPFTVAGLLDGSIIPTKQIAERIEEETASVVRLDDWDMLWPERDEKTSSDSDILAWLDEESISIMQNTRLRQTIAVHPCGLRAEGMGVIAAVRALRERIGDGDASLEMAIKYASLRLAKYDHDEWTAFATPERVLGLLQVLQRARMKGMSREDWAREFTRKAQELFVAIPEGYR